jgi:hypothetical protein
MLLTKPVFHRGCNVCRKKVKYPFVVRDIIAMHVIITRYIKYEEGITH